MMMDLGKHATEVLAAYGVGLAGLMGVVALYVRRNAKVRRTLEELEDQ